MFGITSKSLVRISLVIGFILAFVDCDAQVLFELDSADISVKEYLTISAGGMGGEYEYWDGWNDQVVTRNYWIGGIGISRNRMTGQFKRRSMGIRLYGGPYRDLRGSNPGSALWRTEVCINPYFHFDWRVIGLGGGLHFGSFPVIESEGYIYPQVEFRLGPIDIFYFEFLNASHFPGTFPAPLLKFGFGSGLGFKNGTAVRVGITAKAGFYLNACIPIKEVWLIEPFIGHAYLGGPPFGGGFFYWDLDFISGTNIGLTIHYRLSRFMQNL
jgi:hypothetical protein